MWLAAFHLSRGTWVQTESRLQVRDLNVHTVTSPPPSPHLRWVEVLVALPRQWSNSKDRVSPAIASCRFGLLFRTTILEAETLPAAWRIDALERHPWSHFPAVRVSVALHLRRWRRLNFFSPPFSCGTKRFLIYSWAAVAENWEKECICIEGQGRSACVLYWLLLPCVLCNAIPRHLMRFSSCHLLCSGAEVGPRRASHRLQIRMYNKFDVWEAAIGGYWYCYHLENVLGPWSYYFVNLLQNREVCFKVWPALRAIQLLSFKTGQNMLQMPATTHVQSLKVH